MMLRPRARKLLLVAHVTVSVGWIGAAAAYLSLDVAVARADDPQLLRAAYIGMNLIAQRVIVPLALASLISGVIISAATKWGLFRHYWVLMSLVLTTIATVVLLIEAQVIRDYGAAAADPATSAQSLQRMGNTLAHSIGGTFILLVVLVLNMYKPRGLTSYGWRKEHAGGLQGRESRPRGS